MPTKLTSNSPTPGDQTGADVTQTTGPEPDATPAPEAPQTTPAPRSAPAPAQSKPHTAMTTPGPQTPAVPTTEALFTQADVDRILAERLNRERNKYAGFEDLQTQVQTLAEKLATQEQAAQVAQSQAAQAERSAKIIAAAAAMGFNDPADAVRLLAADSKPEDVEKDLKALVAGKAYLVRRQAQPVSPANPAKSTEPTRPSEAERLAQYLGRSPGAFWAGGGVTVSPKGLED